MRRIIVLSIVLATLFFPAVAPAQDGCAPSAALRPAKPSTVTAPGGSTITRLSAAGGAVTAAALLQQEAGAIIGRGGTLLRDGPFIKPPFGIRGLDDLAREIVLRDDLIYIAAGSAGLVIQSEALAAAVLPLPGLANALKLSGARAYVAAAGAGGGLHIVDLSVPLQPRLLGTAAVFGSSSDVALAGDLAYVAGGVNGGVEVFNIADPAAPTRIGGLITPGAARALVIQNDRAYVAAGICGLQTLDISDPTAPQLMSAVSVGGEALDLALDATTLYVAAGTGGLASFTLDRTNPQPKAQFPLEGYARTLDLWNGIILIAAEAGGLFYLNLDADEAESTPVRLIDGRVGLAVARSADRAFLGLSANGIQTIDLSQPDAPREVGSVAGFTSTPVRALAFDASSQRLYAGVDDVGIVTLELTEGGQLRETQRLVAPGQVTALLHDPVATRLYATVGSSGVAIYDLADPDAPELLQTIPIPGTALGLAQHGDLLLVAQRTGLQIIDLRTNTLRGAFTAPEGSFVQDVALVGTSAVLADRNGLISIALSDPDDPQLLGAATGFTAYRVIADGSRVYVAAGPTGIRAFDLSDPTQPHLLAAATTPGSALDLALFADQLTVADEAGGMMLFTISELNEQLFVPLISQ